MRPVTLLLAFVAAAAAQQTNETQPRRLDIRQPAGTPAADPATRPPAPANSPDFKNGIDRGALDAAGGALESLDAIRDRNLKLMQKDGCPPEVAGRIADLKWKLEMLTSPGEAGEKPPEAPAAPTASPRPKKSTDYAAVVNDWFKTAEDESSAKAKPGSGSLDSVLPVAGAVSARSATAKADPKEIERLQTEIKKLQAGCVAPAR